LPSGERLSVDNSAVGIRKLKRWLMRFTLDLVVVEATGRWHRPLWRNLHCSGLPIAVVDPYRARMFARAEGGLAKTDRLDAAMLARFAAVMAPQLRPPPPQVLEEIGELVSARDAAVAEQTGLKNQLAAASLALLRRQLERRIATLAQDLAALDQAILVLIAADPGLARRFAILTSIPAIGRTVAATLIAGLSELGSASDKAIAALAGLAPITDQSGDRDGARVIFGGRSRVRRMLYLAALSAARHNHDLAAFYRRLRANGKAAKLALIAVARKLVLLANTLIAQDRLWQPSPPHHA
jgi:transposase